MAGGDLTRASSSKKNEEPGREVQSRLRGTEKQRANGNAADGAEAGGESWRSLSGGLVIGGKSTPYDGAGKSCPPGFEPMTEAGKRFWSARVAAESRLVRRRRERPFAFCPVVGAVAISGRQREMEDAVTVKTNFCCPRINRSRPAHYFGVFDGHGGSHYALICKEHMHNILAKELMLLHHLLAMTIRGEGLSTWVEPHTEGGSIVENAWKGMFTRSFIKTETVALKTCCCGVEGFKCTCDRTKVFCTGSTAVVMVLTDSHKVVGNVGDSRAVLFRDNKAVPLSVDHKPSREDERARIRSEGGRVIVIDTPRVEGVLAMTRAIGDSYLKPSVTSEPEVTFTRRNVADEFVIIASDGLWDVMSNEMACHVTFHCLRDPVGPSAESLPNPPSRSEIAANLLTRLALARNSRDNISVVVVDLKKKT